MKKRNISLVIILVAMFAAMNADAKILGISFGPKVGLNVNKFEYSGSSSLTSLLTSDNRCGVTAGLTAEYIAPAIGIGADISVMYTYMTTKVSNVVTDALGNPTNEDQNICGSFIEIPLHLKYKLSIPAISSFFKPYVFTGPSVALKVSGEDSYGQTKNTQWGWDLGLGFEVINHLQIGAGYTFGLNNVMKDINLPANINVSDNIKIKNNYWTVTAAWMF